MCYNFVKSFLLYSKFYIMLEYILNFFILFCLRFFPCRIDQ